MRVSHGAVALDIADDLPVIVADLQAPAFRRQAPYHRDARQAGTVTTGRAAV